MPEDKKTPRIIGDMLVCYESHPPFGVREQLTLALRTIDKTAVKFRPDRDMDNSDCWYLEIVTASHGYDSIEASPQGNTHRVACPSEQEAEKLGIMIAEARAALLAK